MKRAVVAVLAVACAARPTRPTTPAPKTAPREVRAGFIPLEFDVDKGRVYLRLDHLGEDLLYQVTLSGGLGSNPVGLDRGALRGTHVVRFERHGPKVLLVERPVRFRAIGGSDDEQRAVEQSFASSVLWGFAVEPGRGDATVVDATDFLLSDMAGAAAQLRTTGQGSYEVDDKRSAVEAARCGAFPRNTEIETILTLTTKGEPGPLVAGVTPVPESVTLGQRHSFVALPPAGFTPRRPDPRLGLILIEVQDLASAFTAPLERRFAMRHRTSAPIVYHVDPSIPQPIRDAILEGASWWKAGFAAAGFPDLYRVELLPPGADPMDVRYNMIHWVHRATRGWSMGETIADPRTGEILRGVVLLGSERIRQDVLLARGLVAQYDEHGARPLDDLDPKTSPSLMALARIRQLAAHEVGHTLGLDHNMAASAAGRASVMDYPAPRVKNGAGGLDLSEAYATGLGAYDLVAMRYLYTRDDAAAAAAAREAPLFIKDTDARALGGAHPQASLFDDGADAVAALRHEMEVRGVALGRFGLGNLPVGEPLSSLEERLLPLYLHHRYQLDAAAKSIGGVSYGYAVKEDGAVVPPELRRVVPAARQREALAAVLATLDPGFLVIPQRIVELIPPRAAGTEEGVAELFPRHTDPLFDPVAAATTAIDLTLDALLEEHRAARLIQLHDEDPANPSFLNVTDALTELALAPGTGRPAAVTRATRTRLAAHLIALASTAADPDVRAAADDALRVLARRLAGGADRLDQAHRRATRAEIDRFLARPGEPTPAVKAPPPPAGAPI